MLEKLEEYIIAESIPQAVKLLRDNRQGRTVAITGAIDHHWWRLQNARRFVDTSRLGLSFVKSQTDGLHLGAATVLEDVVTSKAAQRFAGGLLPLAALGLASPLRRHTTSLAALLINAVPFVDIIPALMALDAKVKVRGQRTRMLKMTELFAGKGRAALEQELLLEVIVPKPKGKIGVAIERHALTPSDDAILVAIATVKRARGAIESATIAVGGGLNIPARFPEVEKVLAGAKADIETLRNAAGQVAHGLHPIADARASAEHRREICSVIVRRALARAAGLEVTR